MKRLALAMLLVTAVWAQEKKMSTTGAMELPFGLRPEQLAATEILYEYQSGKTGGGYQRILLRGDGAVTATKTRVQGGPEEQREGKLPRMNFIRLLEVAEGVNFFGLEDVYRPEAGNPYWIREITVKLSGGKTHTVGVMNERLQVEFEHLAGAIKAISSLAVPDVLKGRFFPNL